MQNGTWEVSMARGGILVSVARPHLPGTRPHLPGTTILVNQNVDTLEEELAWMGALAPTTSRRSFKASILHSKMDALKVSMARGEILVSVARPHLPGTTILVNQNVATLRRGGTRVDGSLAPTTSHRSSKVSILLCKMVPGRCRWREVPGRCRWREVPGRCRWREVPGRCRWREVPGKCRWREVPGRCRWREVPGKCRWREVPGRCRWREVPGRCRWREVPKRCRWREVPGR